MVDGKENYKFDLEVKGFIYTRVTRDIVELLRIKYVKEKNNKKTVWNEAAVISLATLYGLFFRIEIINWISF